MNSLAKVIILSGRTPKIGAREYQLGRASNISNYTLVLTSFFTAIKNELSTISLLLHRQIPNRSRSHSSVPRKFELLLRAIYGSAWLAANSNSESHSFIRRKP